MPQEQLDPQVVNMAKAIRQSESGGDFSAQGKSGEHGAYQFTEPTWNKTAAKYGIKASLKDSTPEQQNEAAYRQIKEWKDDGYNPGQIASMWNAGEGEPDAYTGKFSNGKPSVGVNKFGAKFDVPTYAKSVAAAYQKLKSGGQAGIDPNNPSATAPKGGFVDPTKVTQSENNFVTPPAQISSQSDTTDSGDTTENKSPDSLGQKIVKGAGSFFNAVASPLEGLAAAPFQAIEQPLQKGLIGAAKATGLVGKPNSPFHVKEDNVGKDVFAEGAPSPLSEFGADKTPITPLNLEAKAGDAAQVGSYFVPGAEGLGGTIAGGAAAGLLQGAGNAMSQQKNLGDVALQGGEGALLGGGVAGATRAVGGLIKSTGGAMSGANEAKALQGLKDAYGSALNLNAGEKAFENRSGKDLAQVLMENRVPLSRTAEGRLDASKAIPLLQEKAAPLDTEAQTILANAGKGAKVNLFDVAEGAKAGIAKKATTALDRQQSAKEIDTYINAEVEARTNQIAQDTYGLPVEKLSPQQRAKVVYDAANPTALEADKLKTGFWNATFNRTRSDLQNHIPYQIGSSMRDSIEAAVPNEKLAEINSERGNLIDAIRRLQKMDGVKPLKGGKMGHMMAGTVGAIAGAASGTGTLGALAGDYFGSRASEFLQNPATKIGIAEAKLKGAKLVPGILGKSSKVIGKGVREVGSGIKKSARVAGLLGNVLLNQSGLR